jgi:glucose-6-phosphate isomerase, archaeal
MTTLNLPFCFPVTPEGFQATANMKYAQRRLSEMQEYFSDREAIKSILVGSNPLIYEYWEMEYAGVGNGVSFGMTRIQPGQIGNEYYLTKGHFHADGLGDEMHHTLGGQGIALLLDREENTTYMEMQPGRMCYYPGHLAHRTINTGLDPLIFVGIWPPHIVHDYETLKRSGFPRLVVPGQTGPELINNPRFSSLT